MLLATGHLSVAISARAGSSPSLKRSSLISASPSTEDYVAKIKNRLFHREIEISPSSYDTAWVAMVPSREYSRGGVGKPCFPQCLEWIMENQNPDGSWGLSMGNQNLMKDSLSCTLACLLALRKWDVGHQLVQKGLDFIGSNGCAASDTTQHTPIGYEIVFPKMIDIANQLDLTLPFDQTLVDNMFRYRDSEIKRDRNLEYIAEGVGDSCNWKQILSQKRRNGSLFNSPATTAAALIHSHDDQCYEYLKTFNNWVPTVSPYDAYTRLCIVDTLESLGIDHHFQFEINSILDETYRSWQRKEEDIFADLTCRAMAFRLLRMKRYDVSSDELAEFADEELFFKTVSIQYTGVHTVLELNRASKLRIHEEDVVLEKIFSWTSRFLKQQNLNGTILDKRLKKEVELALKNVGSTLDRIENKENIKLYDVDHFQILKTAYRCPTLYNEDILQFSRHDFNLCQSQHREELQELERWYTNSGIATFGRNVLQFCFFQAASILPHPHQSEARVCFAKNVVIGTRTDDLFDSYASYAEALGYVELARKWSKEAAKNLEVSKEGEILFTAMYNTVNEWAEIGRIKQGRCVKANLIALCADSVERYMTEASLLKDERVISLDEYLSVTLYTVGFKVSSELPAYLLGPKLSDEMLTSSECTSLNHHGGLVARYLNDLRTFKREVEEGKNINAINLLAAESQCSVEEAISKIQQLIEYGQFKLLQIALQTKGNLLPVEYRDYMWRVCKLVYYTYAYGDGYGSRPNKISEDLKELIYTPIA